MSNIIRNWQVGSVTDWRGPLGSFSYHTNQYSHIYLLAAGTGITPIYQIIRHIVQNDEEETILKLLYASRTYQDILMRKELNDLAHYWNFKVLYYVSADAGVRGSYGEQVHEGRICPEDVQREVTALLESSLAVVCGTRDFEADMKSHLIKIGFDNERVLRF
ncbi:putative NADH-cytochrome b5 reductase-like [Apostichopus japonicus]|uniref:cytochrome-b5 reductase n=1 Tax=Stichopus japonicus TaxID=307972 RepID=A0A2G8JEP4_STIJA|nr:putative NADH-cytochrome b5 reductase-like [Apostichopus japonicus]